MKILGVDPGSTLIGYAFLEEKNDQIGALDYGLLKIEEKETTLKLKEIGRKIKELLKDKKPDVAGVEKLFFSKNKKTAIEVAQARGVIMYCLLEKGIPVLEITPMQVKSAVAGYGGADKKAISKMTKQILGLDREIKEDNTADALAIAITTASYQKNKEIGI